MPTTPQEKKVDAVAHKVIALMNAHQTDSVYNIAGEAFKQQISLQLWRQINQTQLVNLLPFKSITFIGSDDGINKYKLEGKVLLTLNISLDSYDKIANFTFVPYQEEVKPAAMTDEEQKTDAVAIKVLDYLNAGLPNSAYAFAGEKFRTAIDSASWRNITNKQLAPLLPLQNPVFVGSKNGINKYKTGQLQLLLSLDKTGKFEVFAIQPYQEDAKKAEKAATDNPMHSQLDSVINKWLSAYIQTKGNVGLTAAVYYKGADHYYNYGETVNGNHQLPNAHTLYEIGSITKTFTSLLLARAVTEGLVTLADPITKFLPDSVAANTDLKIITLKQLSNHTSGLPRMPDNLEASVTDLSQPYEHYSEALMFAFLKKYKATGTPGTTYQYSNLATGLLGVILEKIYHKPYDELIKLYITQPLQLTETKVKLTDVDVKRLAQGYNEAGNPAPVWRQQSTMAAGAIKSTATDMLQYGKMQLPKFNSPLSKAIALTHPATIDDGVNKVGLSWHYLYTDADPVIQHTGATGGYRAAICVNLKRDMVLVLLTNNASTGDALGLNLMAALEKASPQ